MARKIQIAPGLALDPDYFGAGTFALLAKKGAGKSYTSRVLAEEMWATNVPFALFDPMGVGWGLRSSADGRDEGIPVAIFGGKHGDAPLERGAGRLMADLAIDEGLSMILDFSEFGSHAAEREFAHAFLDRMYFRNDRLYHLVIDEADLFAPQKPQKGAEALLGVMDNVVRRGRNRGIGVTLMTQRPAVLNKDVLTQIDGLVAMRVIGLPDREAVDEWVKGHGEDPEEAKKVRGTLAGLANGESWWWVPELGILKRVQIRASRTFDSSPSRTRSTKAVRPKGFADVDMGAIEAKMTETITRAKAEDPKELRKQLAQAQRRVRELESQPPPQAEPTEVRVEVPVIPPFVRARQDHAQQLATTAVQAAEQAKDAIAELSADLRDFERNGNGDVPARARAVQAPRAETPAAPTRRPAPSPPVADGDVTLKKGAREMLVELVQHHPARLTRRQLATQVGIKSRGSTFSSYLSNLRQAGFLDESGGTFGVTQEGFDYLGETPPAPKTGAEILAMWRARLKLGARQMLDELVARYPEGMSREDLAAILDIDVGGSTLSSYLSNLRTNELITEDGRGGAVYASETLFVA